MKGGKELITSAACSSAQDLFTSVLSAEMANGEMVNKVVFTIRIYPDSDKVDFSELQERIREKFKDEQILRSWQEPLAFGISTFIFDITAPEEEGVSERYERLIKEIEGVSEIQVESVRRLTKLR